MQYQWKWQHVDKPGVWAFGGYDKDNLTPARDMCSFTQDDIDNGLGGGIGWRAYLGPIPDIAPPEPELRLPEGWGSEIREGPSNTVVEIYGPPFVAVSVQARDKKTAMLVAQAAVDELERKANG